MQGLDRHLHRNSFSFSFGLRGFIVLWFEVSQFHDARLSRCGVLQHLYLERAGFRNPPSCFALRLGALPRNLSAGHDPGGSLGKALVRVWTQGAIVRVCNSRQCN